MPEDDPTSRAWLDLTGIFNILFLTFQGISGDDAAYLNGREIILKPIDEEIIPKGTGKQGKCLAGVRTIHVSGSGQCTDK